VHASIAALPLFSSKQSTTIAELPKNAFNARYYCDLNLVELLSCSLARRFPRGPSTDRYKDLQLFS